MNWYVMIVFNKGTVVEHQNIKADNALEGIKKVLEEARKKHPGLGSVTFCKAKRFK